MTSTPGSTPGPSGYFSSVQIPTSTPYSPTPAATPTRGRPRGAAPANTTVRPGTSPAPGTPRLLPGATEAGTPKTPAATGSLLQGGISARPATTSTYSSYFPTATSSTLASSSFPAAYASSFTPSSPSVFTAPTSTYASNALLSLGTSSAGTSRAAVATALDEDGDGDDELLPGMADEDYSAQQSFQSQSKDNLKVLMDNFSDLQYDRYEAYRRHALPKQAVRKVIQQTLGMQVSPPVAQIVAGFAKVFVGEMVEKARAVQRRRGETGPLSPDHLREAYRMYQQETGSVGCARPLRGKKLFVR